MATMLSAAGGVRVHSFATAAELSASLGATVAEIASKSGKTKGDDKPFTVAISGGSLPKLLAAGVLALSDSAIDWKRWRVFFVDERVVPLDHADSNFLGCKEKLFDHVNIDPANIFTINASLSPSECATAYDEDLRAVFGKDISAAKPPKFDLMLLGMGPDGHTASLFPDHPLLAVDDVLVACITNSPKPPPGRITLTLPVINAADNTLFVCTGAGKAPNLAKVLHKEEPLLPAARVSGSNVEWFVDNDAAADFAAGTPGGFIPRCVILTPLLFKDPRFIPEIQAHAEAFCIFG